MAGNVPGVEDLRGARGLQLLLALEGAQAFDHGKRHPGFGGGPPDDAHEIGMDALEPGQARFREAHHELLVQLKGGSLGLLDQTRTALVTPSQMSMAVRPTRKPMACSDDASPASSGNQALAAA